MSARFSLKPRVGEYLRTGHGTSLVLAVREQGRSIDVRDRRGRVWTLHRTKAGTWCRLTGPACSECDTDQDGYNWSRRVPGEPCCRIPARRMEAAS